MKKTKLLFAAPIVLAPAMAIVPAITSCSKSPVSLCGELSEYVNMETTVDGETYYIFLEIKESAKGKQFLPNSLNRVKTGDKELTCAEEANALEDYYEYYTYYSNSGALLIVNKFQGTISIEGATSEIKTFSATGVDITDTDGVAEFELGETLSNETRRVSASVHLKNGDDVELDRGDYLISIPDMQTGDEFKTLVPTETEATVKFGDQTAKFKYKVIKKTVAYTEHKATWVSEPTYSKASTIEQALTDYDNLEDHTGYHTIYIKPKDSWSEVITPSSPYEVKQYGGSYLEIRPLVDPDFGGEEYYYTIKFQGTLTDTATDNAVFHITPDTEASTADSSVTIYGFEFEKPTDSAQTETEFNNITIDGDCHNITVEGCTFYGDDATTGANTVNAVASEDNESPKLVEISECVGQDLNTLYTGGITAAETDNQDLYIYDCEITKSHQLLSVTGDNLKVTVYATEAEVMKDATDDSGVEINGSGVFRFTHSTLTQQTLYTGSDGGLISIANSAASSTYKLVFKNMTFAQATGTQDVNDVYNGSSQSWFIWDTIDETQEGEELEAGEGWDAE